jgi:hypothetical protein
MRKADFSHRYKCSAFGCNRELARWQNRPRALSIPPDRLDLTSHPLFCFALQRGGICATAKPLPWDEEASER